MQTHDQAISNGIGHVGACVNQSLVVLTDGSSQPIEEIDNCVESHVNQLHQTIGQIVNKGSCYRNRLILKSRNSLLNAVEEGYDDIHPLLEHPWRKSGNGPDQRKDQFLTGYDDLGNIPAQGTDELRHHT